MVGKIAQGIQNKKFRRKRKIFCKNPEICLTTLNNLDIIHKHFAIRFRRIRHGGVA